MTAHEVVELLLSEAIDPKRVFRDMNVGVKRVPPPDKVEYDLEVEWENDISPEDSFSNPEDVAFVRQQIDNDNVWGWCQTHVIAKWVDEDGEEFTGDDYLGGCSYRSREDFMQPGGYYDDMKSEAYDRLVKKLYKAGYKD